MKLIKRNNHETERLPVSATNPVQSLRSMHDMMDQLFSDHFLTPFSRLDTAMPGGMSTFTPKVDISETDTDIKVRAEVPGIDPKDVAIEVTEDSLLLSGKVEKTAEEKVENYYRMERSYGEFSREFVLPTKIDTESVSAESKNGVITVTLKKQPSEQKKRVEIKT